MPIELSFADAPTLLTPDDHPATFGDFVAQRIAHLKKSDARTYATHETYWRIYGQPLAPLAWHEITPPVLVRWLEWVKDQNVIIGKRRKLSANYVRGIFSLVETLLSRAVALGFLRDNPARTVHIFLPRKARVVDDKVRSLMPNTIGRLLTAKEIPERFRVEYKFVFFTAVRVGEVRALTFADLKFSALVPFVQVNKQMDYRRRGEPIRVLPILKNKRARDVPLHSQLLISLAHWVTCGYARANMKTPEPNDYLFPAGAQQCKAGASRLLGRHLERLKLPRISYHGLRHSGADAYRNAGVREEDIGTLLGHTSPSVTSIYAEAYLPYLAEQIEKFRLNSF